MNVSHMKREIFVLQRKHQSCNIRSQSDINIRTLKTRLYVKCNPYIRFRQNFMFSLENFVSLVNTQNSLGISRHLDKVLNIKNLEGLISSCGTRVVIPSWISFMQWLLSPRRAAGRWLFHIKIRGPFHRQFYLWRNTL